MGVVWRSGSSSSSSSCSGSERFQKHSLKLCETDVTYFEKLRQSPQKIRFHIVTKNEFSAQSELVKIEASQNNSET